MRKYFSFIVFALMAVFSLAIVSSCSSDDDEEQKDKEESSSWSNSDYIGTWCREYAEGYGVQNEGSQYTQLKSDGTFIDIAIYNDGSSEVDYGRWTVSDDKLILKPTFGGWVGTTLTYEIIEKEKNKLTVSIWGYTAYLIRVSDDTISEYLQ